VLLTAVAGELHTLLERRGEPIEALRIAVMVPGHRAAAAETLGNQVAPLLFGVPGAGAPADRLARIAGTLRAARAATTGRPPDAVPQPLLRGLAAAGLYRLSMNHQRRLHTLVSNVHGPERPLTFAGAPIASYADTLTVTVVAAPTECPTSPSSPPPCRPSWTRSQPHPQTPDRIRGYPGAPGRPRNR